jgi:TonB family protein
MILALFLAGLEPQATTASLATARHAPVPAGDSDRWFTPETYPAAALRARVSGTVVFTVRVDAQGARIDCAVTMSSGSPSLDKGTCAIVMQRGHFIPAQDSAGRAIAGRFSSHVQWVIPPPAPGTVLVTISGKDHRTCAFPLRGQTRHLDPALCRKMALALIKAGAPIDVPVSVKIPTKPGAVLPVGH